MVTVLGNDPYDLSWTFSTYEDTQLFQPLGAALNQHSSWENIFNSY